MEHDKSSTEPVKLTFGEWCVRHRMDISGWAGVCLMLTGLALTCLLEFRWCVLAGFGFLIMFGIPFLAPPLEEIRHRKAVAQLKADGKWIENSGSKGAGWNAPGINEPKASV